MTRTIDEYRAMACPWRVEGCRTPHAYATYTLATALWRDCRPAPRRHQRLWYCHAADGHAMLIGAGGFALLLSDRPGPRPRAVARRMPEVVLDCRRPLPRPAPALRRLIRRLRRMAATHPRGSRQRRGAAAIIRAARRTPARRVPPHSPHQETTP